METYKVYWNGPYEASEIKTRGHIAKEYELNDAGLIKKKENEIDWGIYQIYGTHPIFGDNSILYIGIAEKRGFVERIGDHLKEWILDEADHCQIYIGRLFSNEEYNTISNVEWEIRIAEIEKILIHFCTPPYNSQNIQQIKNNREFVLLNYGRIKRLPFVLSTDWLKQFPKELEIPYYTYDSKR